MAISTTDISSLGIDQATPAAPPTPAPQWPVVALALCTLAVLGLHLADTDPRRAWLLAIGAGLGFALFHAAFGFAGAYRNALRYRDFSGIAAQLVMIAAAVVLFAPILAEGEAFGRGVGAAVAPVSVSMAFGAFIFGVGMQMAGGCASGTLYTAGSGNVRMGVVLIFFCAGSFLATFHIGWWRGLPSLGSVSFGQMIGFGPAMVAQVAALGLLYALARRLGRPAALALWPVAGLQWRQLAFGPWPLLLAAGVLAVLNWATLLVAGHAWSVTWAFTLWAAKVAVALGWDPTAHAFWSGGFTQGALAGPILADNVSVMNIGILAGALLAAALAGRVRPSLRIGVRPVLAAVLGGLVLGYGARLAYGCNIGAFFSGIASTSLHGWVWIVMAFAGNALGLRLRPPFHLDR